MDGKKVRWGVLSTARIGRQMVIPSLQQAKNAEVAAIASESGKAQSVAEEMGIPKHYNSYDELLQDPDIDAVYIPLPNNLHKEWTIKAAQAKKHVLVEKPAALDAAQIKEMLAACRENGVVFMEAFMYRFHDQHKKVKEIIKAGEIGEVKMVRAGFTFTLNDAGNIRFDPQLWGGAIYDVGCYGVNTIRYYLGEPTRIISRGKLSAQGIDLTAGAIMQYANGTMGMFDCSFEMTDRQEYEVVGTKGTITVPFAYRPDKNGYKGVIRVEAGDAVTEYTVVDDQYLRQAEHISESILTGAVPQYSAENTLHNMIVIDAMYESLRKGIVVEL